MNIITLNEIIIAIEQYLNNQKNLFEISGTVHSNRILQYLSIDDTFNQLIYSIELYSNDYRMIIWNYTNYTTGLDFRFNPEHDMLDFQTELLYNSQQLILINILKYINNILKPNNSNSFGVYDMKDLIAIIGRK